MPSLAIAVLTFVAAFASGMAGLALARRLPESHTSERSRDMLAGVAGLLGLLLALTLSLSIADAYGGRRADAAALLRLAAHGLEFDQALRSYGADATPARRLLASELALTHAGLSAETGAVSATGGDIAAMNASLAGLKPADEAQRRALAAADRLYGEIAEARLTMALAHADPAIWPLILTMISWSCLLFGGLGALSRPNATTFSAAALGAAAIAGAMFLVLELSQPYSGAFRLSARPIERTLVEISQ